MTHWLVYINFVKMFMNMEEGRMGLFDSFFAKNSDMKVLEYIKSLEGMNFVNAVKSEYERIKGGCTYTPAMGEFGSFEFAGALLIWRYCRENLDNNFDACGELMIILGDVIACGFNCMSPGEWSDKMDGVINNNKLLDYNEWNNIYRYIKEKYSEDVHRLQRYNEYMKFIRIYNSLPDYKSLHDYYENEGLRISADMPFSINC